MLLDDLAGNAPDIFEANAGVVRALRCGIAGLGEAERTTVLIKEVLLLEAEPGAGIVEDGGALVGSVRRDAVRHHDLAHDEHAVLAGGIRVVSYWLENTVGAVALGMHGGAAVETPERKILQIGKVAVLLDLRL